MIDEVPSDTSMAADWLGLTGKRVVITGAAGGVGNLLAQAFHDVGCVLALLDRDVDACRTLADTLSESSAPPLCLRCDVSNPQDVAEAADTIGAPDILINNAAVLRPGKILDLPLSDWESLLAINLTGYFLCAQAFGRQMMATGGGAMIHISSVAAKFPQPASGAYSVAKAGVDMLSRLIAVEMGPASIRSNVISPCMIETPMSAGFYTDRDFRARREAMVPSRRIGLPHDIAQAALWLASTRSDYVNGTDMAVDGAMPSNLLGLIPRPGFET